MGEGLGPQNNGHLANFVVNLTFSGMNTPFNCFIVFKGFLKYMFINFPITKKATL
jgi:hypothetical protein